MKRGMELKSQVNVTKRIEIQLTDKDILEMVARSGHDDLNAGMARVYFDVPQGGDYSGMSIEIDKENTVTVIYEVKYTEKAKA